MCIQNLLSVNYQCCIGLKLLIDGCPEAFDLEADLSLGADRLPQECSTIFDHMTMSGLSNYDSFLVFLTTFGF